MSPYMLLFYPLQQMNCPVNSCVESFGYDFGDRSVRVNAGNYVVNRHLSVHGQRCFRDHVAGMGAEDVEAHTGQLQIA